MAKEDMASPASFIKQIQSKSFKHNVTLSYNSYVDVHV